MARLLTEFLRDGAGEAFAWGRTDCALWACDWVIERMDVDPASHLRGTYNSEMSCGRVLVRHNGLLELATQCFDDAGLVRTAQAGVGDVGVVETVDKKIAMGIRTARGWAMKSPTGITIAPALQLRAWSIG